MTAIRGTGRRRSHPRRKTDLRARVCNCPTTDGRLSIATRFLLLDNRYNQARPRRQSDIESRHAFTKACLLHESCQSDLLRDNEAIANAAKEPAIL